MTLFPIKSEVKVPQADDIQRVMDLVKLVGQGVKNAESIADKLEVDPRQSSYYREAAEILGFLSEEQPYTLTELGKEFVSLERTRKTGLTKCALLCNPIVRTIVACLQTGVVQSVTKKDVEDLISSVSDLRGETVPRRAQTVLAWVRWLQQNDSVLSVESDVIRLDTQRRLF